MLDELRRRLNRRLERLLGEQPPAREATAPQAEVDALRARGNSFLASGDIAQAGEWFQKALQLKPDDADALVCMGYVLKEQGKLGQARITLKRAIQVADPQFPVHETYYLLGQISEQQDDLADAERQLDAALKLQPDFIRACTDLCRIYGRQGNRAAIRATLERCVALRPDVLEYRLLLSDICHSAFDYPGMIENLSAAIRIGGETAPVCTTLGLALCRVGDISRGQQMLARGEALDPGRAYVTQYELGVYYIAAGELERGLKHMEDCIVLKPDFLQAHSTALATLSHARSRKSGDYERAALRFAEAVRSQATWTRGHHAVQSGQMDMRIGFVSADFRKHPVAYFLLDVLKNFERDGVQLVAYSNNQTDDEVTRSLQVLFDEWHPISQLSDDAAAELIDAHRIDMLVDLGGHTGDNRLGVFARRPAPVQVTWLGYWASTGLKEIDYFLADPVSVPEDSTEWFAEQVYRLPHIRICLTAPQPSRPIPVAEPPCLTKGYTTFGSFQQASKMTPRVLALWAQILEAVPRSRLRLQNRALMVSSVRDKLVADLGKAGINLSRVDLLGSVELEEYFEAHAEVDILLDTFPYPGGTTTAFALWMGVPTITLDGDTVISRQGTSMLASVGLDDWVAATETEYLNVARQKSANLPDLQALRKELRRRAEASSLFDTKSFARELRAAFFVMREHARTKGR